MKLSSKLWIYFIVSSILAVILFISLSLFIGKISQTGYTNQTLEELANQVINEITLSDEVTSSSLIQTMNEYHSDHPSVQFEWFTTEGHILYSSSGRTQPYSFSEYSDLFVNEPFNLWIPEHDINLIYPVEINGQSYYLHLQVENEAMNGTAVYFYVREWSSFFTLIVPLLAFIITPYFFTYFFFFKLRKRLKKLNDGLSKTTLDQQVEIDDQSQDEIGQLSQHFNVMSRRIHEQVAHIQEQEDKRKSLISNLSHDLRTPLTNILGYADSIKNGLYINEKELKAHSEVIVRRSQYMEKLINTLFEVSQSDLHGIQPKKERCNVPSILRKIITEYLPVLEIKHFNIDIDIPDVSNIIMIDPHLIERVIRNLLDNAMKYGDSGNYIGVKYREDNDQVTVAIIDRGKGIPAEQLPFLFDRFYQGSQNRNKESFGLGLSIAKEFTNAHNGDITVHSIPGSETCFTLSLPK
ncbi:HAMP domain-containing sensor histidine kinase [Gracilibacillus sp. D59]|uniref:HAMP domain-containing sensor histidine kinase n=1 Tax=Gracilibacillus sp. D59 TaxID=3457434 RepID=UPI003FCED330